MQNERNMKGHQYTMKEIEWTGLQTEGNMKGHQHKKYERK